MTKRRKADTLRSIAKAVRWFQRAWQAVGR